MNATQNQTFSILFWGNKARINKSGELPIYARVTVDGKRAEISLQRSVTASLWDQDAQRLKGKGEQPRTVNTYLDLTVANIQKIYNHLLSTEKYITAQMIKQRFTGADRDYKTLVEAIEYHHLKMKEMVQVGEYSKRTLDNYAYDTKQLRTFMQKKLKISDIPLPELRMSFITEFEHYLRLKGTMSQNTIHKMIKRIKVIINMAVRLEWLVRNPFDKFVCSYTNPERKVLTQEEIDILINKPLVGKLEQVRDMFVFCCYTGFAYAELRRFTPSDVIVGIDREKWLSIKRQKTGTRESVPLLPIPLDTVEKYKLNEASLQQNKLFPSMSLQSYNTYLKRMALVCEIDKKVTSHIARHTFATTITLTNGVPIETVSSMLGHKDISTTQIYAKIVDQKVSDDMKNLRNRLSQSIPNPLTKIS
jgi:site-specific recombinase XerD